MRVRVPMSCNLQLPVMIHGKKECRVPQRDCVSSYRQTLHTCYVDGDLLLIAC
jgi:hypothetical protein